jgi:tetratricopeptide (TPR) repeat protein
VLPGVDGHRQALELLEGFEGKYPEASDLIGRVLRARIIAYEGLGWLAQAEQEIPRYVQSDPERAAATLQALFEAKTAEVERLRKLGRRGEAQRKTQSALLLAEQIYAWARRPGAGLADRDRSALALQLAEARLAAGQLQAALDLFKTLSDDPDLAASGAHTARLLLGLADTLIGLERYADALPHCNRLFRQTDKNTPLWWRALLGDLQCRTELGHDPAAIIRVIEQHRFLYRGRLGGTQVEGRFQALLERNRRRLETGR